MLYGYKSAIFLVLIFGLAACSKVSNNNGLSATEDVPQSTASVPSGETPTILPADTLAPTATFLPSDAPPRSALNEFTTDFSKHSVSYDEILSGGPPKDGIPAIDDPKFVSVNEADDWLQDREPVIFVEADGKARAYPIQILMWHEIVNDTLAGLPLTVTFCPLCNTAIAFERTVNGQVLDFGTTGRLRFSNLIMYDRQTETWWQQATGDAIVGELLGTQLDYYPAQIISWQDFKNQYPDGSVLSRETGHPRDYGRNPYAGYDDINQSPFLFRGDPTPGQLLPMERVLTLELNGEAVAYPYQVLSEVSVVNDTVGGEPVVIVWVEGTASALDAGSVSGGRDVGTAAAFSRLLEGDVLEFTHDGNTIVDTKTGSTWNVLGHAVSGQLAGNQLLQFVSINHFWFSWAAFQPETRIYQP
jgi:hypothetical protein